MSSGWVDYPKYVEGEENEQDLFEVTEVDVDKECSFNDLESQPQTCQITSITTPPSPTPPAFLLDTSTSTLISTGPLLYHTSLTTHTPHPNTPHTYTKQQHHKQKTTT
eukprot:TRINITY_DN5500_c0_g3_i2.p1 TRINITY_DN5500_c0_g3~~TRINITY_DN5500_c0_g3_i2.p1  ORF type:complete len:108 (-),score=15.87 TRINITY_DN5500_c0_g3_i2:94-417(-)